MVSWLFNHYHTFHLVNATLISTPMLTVSSSVNSFKDKRSVLKTMRSIRLLFHSIVSSRWTTWSNKPKMIMRSNGTYTMILLIRKSHQDSSWSTLSALCILVSSRKWSNSRLMQDSISKPKIMLVISSLLQRIGSMNCLSIPSNQVSTIKS